MNTCTGISFRRLFSTVRFFFRVTPHLTERLDKPTTRIAHKFAVFTKHQNRVFLTKRKTLIGPQRNGLLPSIDKFDHKSDDHRCKIYEKLSKDYQKVFKCFALIKYNPTSYNRLDVSWLQLSRSFCVR